MYESVDVVGLTPSPNPFLSMDYYHQNRGCLIPDKGLVSGVSRGYRTPHWSGSNHSCRAIWFLVAIKHEHLHGHQERIKPSTSLTFQALVPRRSERLWRSVSQGGIHHGVFEKLSIILKAAWDPAE
ncbi:hypothetical protein PO909_001547 [Leuciscus waleckii]